VVPRAESDEYVEVVNLGGASQDLLGWKLKDSEGTPVFQFPRWELGPGDVIRVYTNEMQPEWGGFSFGSGRAVWNNTSPDTAELYNGKGELVSSRSYPPGCD
jgi:hypothetical protein